MLYNFIRAHFHILRCYRLVLSCKQYFCFLFQSHCSRCRVVDSVSISFFFVICLKSVFGTMFLGGFHFIRTIRSKRAQPKPHKKNDKCFAQTVVNCVFSISFHYNCIQQCSPMLLDAPDFIHKIEIMIFTLQTIRLFCTYLWTRSLCVCVCVFTKHHFGSLFLFTFLFISLLWQWIVCSGVFHHLFTMCVYFFVWSIITLLSSSFLSLFHITSVSFVNCLLLFIAATSGKRAHIKKKENRKKTDCIIIGVSAKFHFAFDVLAVCSRFLYSFNFSTWYFPFRSQSRRINANRCGEPTGIEMRCKHYIYSCTHRDIYALTQLSLT